jgi:hypothetical protein
MMFPFGRLGKNHGWNVSGLCKVAIKANVFQFQVIFDYRIYM